MDFGTPFGYPIETYIWVIGLASAAGMVKNINYTAITKQFSLLLLLRDILTGGFSGLMAFWICENYEVKIPLNAVAIAIAGIMGARAWEEIETVIRGTILMLAKVPKTSQKLPSDNDK